MAKFMDLAILWYASTEKTCRNRGGEVGRVIQHVNPIIGMGVDREREYSSHALIENQSVAGFLALVSPPNSISPIATPIRKYMHAHSRMHAKK